MTDHPETPPAIGPAERLIVTTLLRGWAATDPGPDVLTHREQEAAWLLRSLSCGDRDVPGAGQLAAPLAQLDTATTTDLAATVALLEEPSDVEILAEVLAERDAAELAELLDETISAQGVAVVLGALGLSRPLSRPVVEALAHLARVVDPFEMARADIAVGLMDPETGDPVAAACEAVVAAQNFQMVVETPDDYPGPVDGIDPSHIGEDAAGPAVDALFALADLVAADSARPRPPDVG